MKKNIKEFLKEFLLVALFMFIIKNAVYNYLGVNRQAASEIAGVENAINFCADTCKLNVALHRAEKFEKETTTTWLRKKNRQKLLEATSRLEERIDYLRSIPQDSLLQEERTVYFNRMREQMHVNFRHTRGY